MRAGPARYCWIVIVAGLLQGPARAGEPGPVSEGDGRSTEHAVRFPRAGSGADGIIMQDIWIRAHYPGYRVAGQWLIAQDGRFYDSITIVNDTGDSMTLYFDVTDWWRKRAGAP